MTRKVIRKPLLVLTALAVSSILIALPGCGSNPSTADGGFDFSKYDSLNGSEEKAIEALRENGLGYGGETIRFDGIAKCEASSMASATKDENNGTSISVTIEKDDPGNLKEAMRQTALQAAALQAASNKAVSVTLTTPDPDKPGYVVKVASVSYDVKHPAPDSPADTETMLAAARQWETRSENSALGATIEDLEL